DRDAKKQLEAARDYQNFKEVPWNTVCPLLQNILDSKSDSFFNIKYQVGGRTEVNRISVRTEANRIIAAFPKEGLEFYQQAYGQVAAGQLADAVKANYDPAGLSEVSQRYFHTKAGGEATVLLGTLHLDRGNYLEASAAFERVLARPNNEGLLTSRTLFKAALALKRSGDPRHVAPARAAADKLLVAVSRDGLKVGRRTYTAEQVRAELERPAGASRIESAVAEWTGRYGNASRNGTVAGGPPFLVPVFDPSPMVDPTLDAGPGGQPGMAAAEWIRSELARQYASNPPPKALPLPGFFPVTTPDVVVYRGYGGVYAVAARDHVHLGRPVAAGDLRWIAKTEFGVHQLLTPGNHVFKDSNVYSQVRSWWQTYTATGADSVLAENPQLGALAHDGQAVYYLDEVAVPPPPVVQDPNFGGFPGGMPQGFVNQSGKLAAAIRAGELNAVDLVTGQLVWSLGRFDQERHKPAAPAQVAGPATEDDADKLTSAFHMCLNAVFLGPPLPLNGRLYVLIEQAGAIRLLCLDPRNLTEAKFLGKVTKTWKENDVTRSQEEVEEVALKVPTLVWQQKLGRPANPLPGDSVRRLQGAFLAAGDGILVCPTNSGAVIGVDIMSRSLLWAHAYRKLDAKDNPGGMGQAQMMGMRRGGGVRFNPDGSPILPQQLDSNRWRAAAPVVAAGRVVLSAYDSAKLECLDLRTGKVVWSVPRKDTDLYVGGVVNDKVLVVGKGEVRAYPLTADPGDVKPVWTAAVTATPTGHGIAGKGVYYLPV
ncbi:MAG: PQQ-binding-like beta-propeller repeat protein, partial [Gemmataceae bacterium]|nr:PQQ-binding-like beta-propeller repeat protein [Gemmataceae bacterium]